MARDFPSLRREISVADLPRTGIDLKVEANPAQRDEIARRFSLLGVEALSGAYHVGPVARGVRVRGEMVARIRQTCVVTLDPFETELREPVDLTFAAEVGPSKACADRIDISPDDDDPPEPLLDGKIDLGAVTLEFLALGLDPYPRKPGARFAHGKAHENREPERSPSPFAALAGHPRKAPTKE